MPALRFVVLTAGWFTLAGRVGVASEKEFRMTAEDRAHWAFQPLQRSTEDAPGGANRIDYFVSAKLAEKGLTMNPPASRRELIRRASFDLTGLPPSPEAVAAFERSDDPDSYGKLIDHLLSLPQYGERWGRHWLDLARFAQSQGYERDAEKPLAWRYRDYVINAFNADKPYDRFVIEQLAGDELPDGTADSVVATAFQQLGVWDDDPASKAMAQFDGLDDIVSTAGGAFLGLSIGCARCHDHKLDPIPQRDYYAMLAFFRGVRHFENGPPSENAAGFARLAPPRHVWNNHCIEDPSLQGPEEWTLAVREAGAKPPATHIHLRGNPAAEGPEVEPAFPLILTTEKPAISPVPGGASSGRRLAVARWIASPANPLTARVMVNRVWQHHFGKGIVRTTSDFGRAGAAPTHPELLDMLAAAFIDSGWSLKKLHRLIMVSQVYRQSSFTGRQDAISADPGNELLWHQELRRVEAEALRDAVLSVSGTLNPAMGGRGFFPHLSGEVLAGQSRPGLYWDISSESEQARRSIYAFVRRTMAIPLLQCFDYSNTASPITERTTTTVAPQALMLLNDAFMHQQAAAFAERLTREAGKETSGQIRRAWQLALSRDPSPQESEWAEQLLVRQTKAFTGLTSRLTFRPDVSEALSGGYLASLQPSRFLTGPAVDWSYHRGFWAAEYEGIRVVERERGPFALWEGGRFKDGSIDTAVTFPGAAELAGLLFRASAEGGVSRGYEVLLDPRRQKIALRRHGEKAVTLVEAEASIPSGEPFALHIECSGARMRVTLHGRPDPVIEITDPDPLNDEGRIGVRTWGGAVRLDALTIHPAENGPQITVPSGTPPPERRALESLCLLLFNLNEFVYID